MIVSCGLLAVVIGLSVQMLASTALERRYSERRAIALQEAANLVERVSAIAYPEITTQRLKDITLSDDARKILPDAVATLTLHEEPASAASGGLAAKRVQVELKWMGAGNSPEAPVRLSYWAYPLAGGKQ
jgi:hypothetical protein